MKNTLLATFLFLRSALAGPTLPTIVSNDMLLQRDESARVWGKSSCPDGSVVTVQLTDSGGNVIDTQELTVSFAGFVANLAPQPGSFIEHNIIFTDCTGSTPITGVVFGDVFHCSGQSNMERPLTNTEFSGDNFQATQNYLSQYSYIRWFAMKRENSNGGFDGFNTPSRGSGWLRASDTSGAYGSSKDTGWPSRMCAGMIEELHKIWHEGPFPIGFVQTAQGRTEIEQWMSAAAQSDSQVGGGTCGGTDIPPAGLEYSGSAGTLYDAYLVPILNMRFKASVWMQGEKNFGNPGKYKCMLPAMIKDWQNKFGMPDMPFYTVLIDGEEGPAHGDDSLAAFRMAQIEGSQKAHRADWVNSIDQGYYSNIHSPYKLEVGRRIAMKVMRDVYGQPQIDSEGPRFVNAATEENNGINYVRINFDPDTVEDLQVANTVDCANNRASDGCCSTKTMIEVNGVMASMSDISVDNNSLLINIDNLGVAPGSFTGVTFGYHNYLGCMIFSNFACQAGLIPADPVLNQT